MCPADLEVLKQTLGQDETEAIAVLLEADLLC
jgi:hypothetical protein